MIAYATAEQTIRTSSYLKTLLCNEQADSQLLKDYAALQTKQAATATKANALKGMASGRVGIMKAFNRPVKEEPISEAEKELIQLQCERQFLQGYEAYFTERSKEMKAQADSIRQLQQVEITQLQSGMQIKDHLKPLLAIPLGNQSKLAYIEQLFLTIDHYTIPIIANGKQIIGNVQKHVIEY